MAIFTVRHFGNNRFCASVNSTSSFPLARQAVEFEWDENKATSNENKHGVTFSEATTIFGDPLELTIPDPDHSSGEHRFLSIGKSGAGNLLVISYTEKQENRIRIISARKATRQEQKYYEQGH